MKTVADPAALAALTRRFSALRPDAERRWGTMTAGEMLCHLADAAAGVLARREGPPPRRRILLKWLALYSSLPWPHGVRTPRSVDPKRDGTRPGDFDTDRARAIRGLQAVAAAGPDALPPGHLYFGRMTLRDWHRWAYRHTDHHLRQFGV